MVLIVPEILFKSMNNPAQGGPWHLDSITGDLYLWKIFCQLHGQDFWLSTTFLSYLCMEGHKHILPSNQTELNFFQGHLPNIFALQRECPSFISAPHWMMLSSRADAWHMLTGMRGSRKDHFLLHLPYQHVCLGSQAGSKAVDAAASVLLQLSESH